MLRNGRIKVVEVPPGPPVMAPLVTEVYGPDEAGRQQLAQQIAHAFSATPDIVAIDTSGSMKFGYSTVSYFVQSQCRLTLG